MTIRAPTVSVIVPCFNGAAYLRPALESALNQTCPPLEVIVIDDGSTDDSAVIAASFGELARIIRQANQGESVARNQGLAVAAGTHVLFLDADDLLHPGALERLAGAVADDPEAVALMGAASFTTDPDAPFRVCKPSLSQFFPSIIQGNPGVPHAWLTPTSLVRRVGGFHEPLQYFEDWDLWCQIGLTGARLVSVDFVGAYYRRHSAAQSYQAPTLARRLGFAKVMERLLAGMLKQPELVEQRGLDAFWGGWTALHACRGAGAKWGQLADLGALLEDLVRCGPDSLRENRFPRLVRRLGIRWAETLRNLVVRDAPAGANGDLIRLDASRNLQQDPAELARW